MDEIDKMLQPSRDAFALVTALFDEDRSPETLLPVVNRPEESADRMSHLASPGVLDRAVETQTAVSC